jgi:Universal stress protein family
VQVLAQKFSSQVTVLYVMHSYAAEVEASGEEFPTRITESIRDFLSPLEIEYEILLSSGEPWQKIVALSRGLDATLIVMSTRGLTGPRHRILGSTTENVLRTSSVPVLTLSPECTAPPVTLAGTVLFPVSRLDVAPANYVSLRGIVREIATSVTLLHVVDPRHAAAATGVTAGAVRVSGLDESTGQSELLRIAGLLTRGDTGALIRFGSAADEVLREIEGGEHDYLLLNIRKAGPLARFMESTVYTVVSHSKIPVFSICQET